ncbi:hypothetical protein BC332_04975 [Capsicum chinense]|uniref:Uncharacterized protein n=1 Tax=Capsicum annuum TaxID=4072 RepID=A0A1U8FX70_CAPAN|nr:uncharacterized protein LOC107859732 [Capsicum annuum]KAF3637556.1 hypothetical protein FXO37_24809 [Capsicum annuum]KAF3644456.1 hypothetical protein FXO38_20156 [Capsicum annuum]PHT90869.1 hypothetical protein T459_05982 [Capsicum annuum]PHU26643.1 hypothetical protein BC332_04975 [Capsicum chinense]
MCSSKTKLQSSPQSLSQINGRPVLQPHSNIVPLYERRNSLKRTTNTAAQVKNNNNNVGTKVKNGSATTPPVSPKMKSPRLPAIKRGNNIDPNGLSSSAEKVMTPKGTANKTPILIKKPKKSSGGIIGSPPSVENSSLKYSSSLIVEAPGSIAAARREQVAIAQVQRKMKIAHYGRTKSAKYEGKVSSLDPSFASVVSPNPREEKRCSFITPNSDPLYIAYHDEEWGVPVHDDNLLFELLVLTGAQVGSDWTSVLKKRQEFRDAFSGFDPEIVSKYNEKKITSTSVEFGIELSQVRGAVDNSNKILEIKKTFGSFDKYLWGFVNNKPIATQYKACNKIPVKTSKSETISKDMVKRGLRYVGPTVIHSFMQAAGLTNDHLITCPRHLQCVALATQPPPAL